MFASRTLEDRNNDPQPLRCSEDHTFNGLGFCRYSQEYIDKFSKGQWTGTLDRRPEFQYGRLPANPILTAFRDVLDTTAMTMHEVAALWVATEKSRPWTDHGNPPEIAHALRVLTLLATLTTAAVS